MDEFLSVPEAAHALGRSERRIRAMIADGVLPAQRVLGRWAVPSDAVEGFASRAGGRPLSQRSAWAVLRLLAGGASAQSIPARLRARTQSLLAEPDPERKLRSWMAARGRPVRVWAPPVALDGLGGDDRVVVSGDRAVRDLESGSTLRAYVGADDVENVIRDHRCLAAGNRSPNVTLWAVDDLSAVPRSPSDVRRVAAPVAALDLVENGDPRAARVGRQILTAALGSLECAAPVSSDSAARMLYGGARPYVAVEDLGTLRGPTDSLVELPLELNWGPQRAYDLSSDSDRRALYERVLNEALRTEQLQAYLNGELLVQLWPQLFLPARVRGLWEGRFPQLVSRRHASTTAV
ncbi:helix-turn-helix domain-containing protein [Mycolicibacterium sp.]|uniref:helix-turn-helix domain-containing protein n=1 Tax=Mycolicibacterium sp. TaxID=2320850 RepID=UPI0037C6B6E2